MDTYKRTHKHSEHKMGTYKRKKENDLSLGPSYENQIVLYSFLMLKENQELGRELDMPAKFDDLVIRETTNDQLKYSCYQIKHKDTKRNSKQSITWSDLFSNNDNPFKLADYFESFLKLDQTTDDGRKFKSSIKELAIVTNVGFAAQPTPENKPSDLNSIAQNSLKTPTGQKAGSPVKFNVTKKDLDYYFEERVNTIFPGKCYRFNLIGVVKVKEALMSIKTFKQPDQTKLKQYELELHKFLLLLVFCVNQPNITELGKLNELILKRYFPFYWDGNNDERRYDEIKKMVLQLFNPNENKEAYWVTVDRRRNTFGVLTQKFKQEVTLGSTKFYESQVLKILFKNLKLDQLKETWNIFKSGTLQQYLLEVWLKEKSPFNILNIFSQCSTPSIIALKLLKVTSSSSLQNRSLIVQVIDANGIRNILSYLNGLREAVSSYTNVTSDTFTCVIEVSPSFTPINTINEEAQNLAFELSKLQDLRKWIHFIIITQQKITQINEISIVEEDDPLQWQNLPDDAKESLFKQTLFVEHNKKTSLEALGFEKNHLGHWMDSNFLAELITHDESRPLYLCLPKYDDVLSSIYVERKLKLPLVDLAKVTEQFKQQVTFDTNDYCKKIHNHHDETYHFLLPIDSNNVSKCLWSESSNSKGFEELTNYVIRSKNSNHQVNESKLLDDNVCFGTGSEGSKLVIVVDLPGKGKSTVLSSLTNQFFKAENCKDLTKLLFRINLRECEQSAWNKCAVLKSTDQLEKYINCLIDNFLNLSVGHSAYQFSSFLIRNTFLNSAKAPVFLLLDGFDEISDNQRELIRDMIQVLLQAKGIKRIILTSRPDHGLEDELENYFLQFPLYLNDLNEDDQVEFLMKQWKYKLSDEDFGHQEAAVNGYARTLVDTAQTVLTEGDKTFLDIPLQCMIVSECFFEDLKRHLNNSDSMTLNDKLPRFEAQDFEILHLYDRFCETKLNILLQEKAKINDVNESSELLIGKLKLSLKRVMKRLSLFHMMTDVSDAEVLCRFPWTEYRKFNYAEDLRLAMKLGMIYGLDEKENFSKLEAPHVKFIHRTFAEYFFATHLKDNFLEQYSTVLDDDFRSDAILNETFTIIIEKIFTNSEYAGIRRFFGRMIRDRIPSAEEEWCIAIKDQQNPSIHWPSIAHAKFNAFITKLAQVDMEQFDISKLVDETTLKKMMRKNRLISLMKRLFVDSSPIASWLISCIKVNASRCKSADELEILANSQALAFLVLLHFESGRWLTENQIHILGATLQWFDPDKTESKFSEYFSKLFQHITELIRKDKSVDPDFLSLLCSRVKYHRNSAFFSDDQLHKHTKNIFCKRYSRNSRVSRVAFTKTNIQAWILVLRKDDLVDMSENKMRSIFLFHVLSLSKLILPDTSLIDWQVEWFEYMLEEYLRLSKKSFDKMYECVDPYSFTVVTEFLVSTLKGNKNLAKAESLTERCLEFLKEALRLAFQRRDAYAPFLVCYHLILSERLLKLSPPATSRLQFFMSAVGRSVLIANERFDCCKRDDTTIEIGYISNELYSDLKRELDNWLNNKLEQLWTEEGNIRFIDFLLKEELFLLSPEQNRRNRRGLMCLLFCNRIFHYIPKKLSEEGLKHLAETIKHVQVGEGKGTLWGCILREEFCKKRKNNGERLQDLKNKLQQFM